MGSASPKASRTVRGASAGGRAAIVCCGGSGSGKTTWCRDLVTAARAQGMSVAGVITWLDRDDGGTCRWVELLATGERRLLGREDPSAACGPDGGRWSLSDETLAWGDRALRAAAAVDVLVVDELGPVELLHGRGWWQGAQAALRGPAGLAVLTVRPPLLPAALELLAGRRHTLLHFDETVDAWPVDSLPGWVPAVGSAQRASR